MSGSSSSESEMLISSCGDSSPSCTTVNNASWWSLLTYMCLLIVPGSVQLQCHWVQTYSEFVVLSTLTSWIIWATLGEAAGFSCNPAAPVGWAFLLCCTQQLQHPCVLPHSGAACLSMWYWGTYTDSISLSLPHNAPWWLWNPSCKQIIVYCCCFNFFF